MPDLNKPLFFSKQAKILSEEHRNDQYEEAEHVLRSLDGPNVALILQSLCVTDADHPLCKGSAAVAAVCGVCKYTHTRETMREKEGGSVSSKNRT